VYVADGDDEVPGRNGGALRHGIFAFRFAEE
jgi:hypothetical protein